MEKIIIAIDPAQPGSNILDFTCYLAALTKSKVTGIFLDTMATAEIPIRLKEQVGPSAYDEKDAYSKAQQLIEKNIESFRQGCINREVRYAVRRDHGAPGEDIITESLYADLLVVNPETSFRQHFEGTPTEFVQDVLKKAHCPVLLAPSYFEPVDEIMFAYDGTPSSIFAIKQFTYLFPQLGAKKASIVQVNDSGRWEDKHKHRLTEWLEGHYTDFHFDALKGDNVSALFDHVFKTKNVFLVMGAYGRNAISLFFKPSTAELLVRTLTQPIFITHL